MLRTVYEGERFPDVQAVNCGDAGVVEVVGLLVR